MDLDAQSKAFIKDQQEIALQVSDEFIRWFNGQMRKYATEDGKFPAATIAATIFHVFTTMCFENIEKEQCSFIIETSIQSALSAYEEKQLRKQNQKTNGEDND